MLFRSASEITRIANATDFNGIYLLNGNLSNTNHNGAGLQSTGALKIHFGTGNDSSEDYYYIQIGSATAASLGVGSLTQAQYIANNGLIPGGVTTTLGAELAGLTGVPGFWTTDFNQGQSGDIYITPDASFSYFFATNNSGDLVVLESNAAGQYVSGENISNGGSSISTQALAQSAMETINQAIISKDKIRANLGSMQNRLENTITNLEDRKSVV